MSEPSHASASRPPRSGPGPRRVGHKGADLIEPGNFEDDLPRLLECDWVVEAVKGLLGR